MQVNAIMTAPVISVDPSMPIRDAARLMLAHGISGLPVVSKQGGGLVGMVSEGDFLRRPELGTEPTRSWWLEWLSTEGSAADDYVHVHGRTVDDVMTRDVVTVRADATLDDVVGLMIKHRVKRLPVVEDGRLVGIIARSDLLRALLSSLSSEPGEVSDDDRIRADLEAELAKQTWGGLVRVSVSGGVVELRGAIFDDRVRAATRVAAENIAGVKSVKDELVYVEPLSGLVIMP
ncbi:CBS domain-containing protein [Kaistia adipata]|uniref:CBS domain-containing protein n=1 Tax=Kaistia adipata TaxID=166954 RepID=UPI000407306B|nr:CBS domain-containing protein [Kaistia adipata]